MLSRLLVLALLLQPAAAVQFDSNRAWEPSDAARGYRAAAIRFSGNRAVAEVHQGAAGCRRADGGRTEVGCKTHRPDAWRWSNLVATIPGARQDRIVIAGHYDTKRFSEFRFVGANDGGSSAAFLIEMAPCAQGPQEPAHDRAALSRRRRSGQAGLGRDTTTRTAAATTSSRPNATVRWRA